LIDEEITNGRSSDKIFLGGFSQGAAMSLYIGYQLPYSLGGIISIAGFLPLHSEFSQRLTKESVKTPCLLLHGDNDAVNPFELSKAAADTISSNGINVTFNQYAKLNHKLSADEVTDIITWVNSKLK